MTTIKHKTVNDFFPVKAFSALDLTSPSLARVPVDSETARKMLERNIKNRRVRRNAVEYIKDQIVNGEWREDHPQPIVFSKSGRIIDGQHRLYAIAELDISNNEALIIRVETGADDGVREYIDTGVPRSLDDRVELESDPVVNKALSQLCTFAHALKRNSKTKPSPDDFKEWFASHHDSGLFVAKHIKREKGVGKIQIAYAAVEYYEINAAKASEFYPALFIVDSDVQQARMLRDYMLRTIGTAASNTNSQMWRNTVYARSVGCMKAHLEGREIKIVREAKW
jgi:hypothetical protein